MVSPSDRSLLSLALSRMSLTNRPPRAGGWRMSGDGLGFCAVISSRPKTLEWSGNLRLVLPARTPGVWLGRSCHASHDEPSRVHHRRGRNCGHLEALAPLEMATTGRACEIHFAVGGSGPEHGFQTSVRSPHIGWKGHLQAIDEALVSRAPQTGDRRKRCESGI